MGKYVGTIKKYVLELKQIQVPSGNLTYSYRKSPFLIGKPSINGSFSIDSQRSFPFLHIITLFSDLFAEPGQSDVKGRPLATSGHRVSSVVADGRKSFHTA